MKKESIYPLVSIVVPTYKNEKFIDKCITNVLKQAYKNWELILVNDASPDATDKIIKKYTHKDKRIKYFLNKKNVGYTISANYGLLQSKGKYIALLGTDDYWIDKNKLLLQVEFLELNKEYALVGTWGKAIDEESNILFDIKYPSEDKEIRSNLLLHNCFIASSVLIRASDMQLAGYFNVNSYTAQDYEMWLRLGQRRKLHNLPKYMVHYTINPNGISQKKYVQQISDTINNIRANKDYYNNYWRGYILFNLRKYYPIALRGKFVVKFKSLFNNNE